MTTRILRPVTAVEDLADITTNPTYTAEHGDIVGSAPQWGDQSDSTYAILYREGPPARTPLIYTRMRTRLEAAGIPVGTELDSITYTVRASAGEGVPSLNAFTADLASDGDGALTGAWTAASPNISVPEPLTTVTTEAAWGDNDEVVAQLNDGAWLFFNINLDGLDSGNAEVTIREAWLTITYGDVVTPSPGTVVGNSWRIGVGW